MNWKSFLWPQIIHTSSSSISKKIEVIEFLGSCSLRVNGLTQSGSVVCDIYKKILPYIKKIKLQKILILGFGAGTFAKQLNKKFKNIKITGVEIDKEIINIAQKYFFLENEKNIEILNLSANQFLDDVNINSSDQKYDLIFIDLYIGSIIDKNVSSKEFLLKIKKFLAKNGIVVFNRLNYQLHINENLNYLKFVKNIFRKVEFQKSYSNLLIFCEK
jgi:spermidine synthase